MKKLLILLGLVGALTSVSVYAKTAASVNGMEITVNEANKALKVLSKGKMTWDKLPKEDRMKLIHMMAPAKLVAEAAKKGLTPKEKEAALAGFWMQKKMAEVKLSDKEVEDAYIKLKKSAEKAKSKQKIPPFDAVKNQIKMQLAQENVVGELMKNAKIKLK
ncbi:MAG: hypothetical protein P794_05120 [Epsilonproteobacteria bacterium (ex Lamellibrachia satsuma)]|nr:MAG: hypothetical protein P794_05120 [Epsilonproteobacteria bacterium (ex Lamellibrachia satsuma)]